MKRTLIFSIVLLLTYGISTSAQNTKVAPTKCLAKIDSLQHVIELLKMQKKIDSLQVLVNVYKQQRTIIYQQGDKMTSIESTVNTSTAGKPVNMTTGVTTDKKVFAKPNPTGTFKDERDGQVYKWVKIGNQTWMAQNLNYRTHAGCWAFDNDSTNRKKYGLLYDIQAIYEACPKGWHVPSEAEWQELENTISNGTDLSAGSGAGYNAHCLLEGMDSGFNLVFGGWISHGNFVQLDKIAYFFTSTREGNPINVRYVESSNCLLRSNRLGSAYKLSVRCVKDK